MTATVTTVALDPPAVLFAWPQQGRCGKGSVGARAGSPITKNKIYERAKPPASVRERFVSQVQQVIWQYKLAPETIGLAEKRSVAEIQVIEIILKAPALDEVVLRTIDRAIGHPVIFQLSHGDRECLTAAWKRPSDADAAKWVVGDYFATQWQASSVAREPMPVALDMGALYERLLRRLLPLAAVPGESLPAQLERITTLRQTLRECECLEDSLNRERQFNRKVEMNAQLRRLRETLAALVMPVPISS